MLYSPTFVTSLGLLLLRAVPEPPLGGPVLPAPSEFDGGGLALVWIWHGMKGTGRRLHPFTPSSNCGNLQLTLQDVKRSPCVTPDVTTRQQLRLLRLLVRLPRRQVSEQVDFQSRILQIFAVFFAFVNHLAEI